MKHAVPPIPPISDAVAPAVTLKLIQEVVAADHGLLRRDLLNERRSAVFVRPRQIAMYLARHMTDKSLPIIGRAFGRDHTTVFHAVNRVGMSMLHDADLRDEIAHAARKVATSAAARCVLPFPNDPEETLP
jgi:chromosomal replication initiator protein